MPERRHWHLSFLIPRPSSHVGTDLVPGYDINNGFISTFLRTAIPEKVSSYYINVVAYIFREFDTIYWKPENTYKFWFIITTLHALDMLWVLLLSLLFCSWFLQNPFLIYSNITFEQARWKPILVTSAIWRISAISFLTALIYAFGEMNFRFVVIYELSRNVIVMIQYMFYILTPVGCFVKNWTV